MAERANQVSLANQALKISITSAREATMGMVADYELTVAANKAVSMGVVKTDKEFAALSKTAAKLGLTMGQSAGKSVDDLTTALARQSPMILDNLGITMKVEEANAEYARRIGKVADALTDAEKKQAFMTIGLERATEAADKANVSLDTHAAKLLRAQSSWQNFKDEMALAGTSLAVGSWEAYEGTLVAITEQFQTFGDVVHLRTKAANKEIQDLLAVSGQLSPAFKNATRDAAAWGAELIFGAEVLERVRQVSGDEQALTLLSQMTDKESQKRNLMEQEADFLERQAKAMERIEKANDAFLDAQAEHSLIYGPEAPAPKKKSGKHKKKAEFLDPRDVAIARGYDGVHDTEVIARAPDMQAQEEAMARELQLRQDRIQLIEHEQELVSMQVSAGLMSAEAEEAVQQRKYQAEKDLLDYQLQAATTRAEIIDLEQAKRSKALQEQQRQMSRSQAIEIKALQHKRAQYEHYGGAVSNVLGAVTIAAIENAKGQEGATARALASIATGIRNQMILTALKEFALAAASAASFNYPGAAQHATAGGLASAAAVAAGIAGAAATAAIPSSPSITSGGSSDGGSSSGGSKGGSSSKGGGDDDGVPTSYYDGGLYSKRPDRMPQAANTGGGDRVTNNITVLGATTEQVGLALRRVQEQTGRSLGGVK
jgi:hypothetical protein